METLLDAKQNARGIVVAWLDLTNAYGSVEHKLVQLALEWYNIPSATRELIFNYDELFVWVKTQECTSDWFMYQIDPLSPIPGNDLVLPCHTGKRVGVLISFVIKDDAELLCSIVVIWSMRFCPLIRPKLWRLICPLHNYLMNKCLSLSWVSSHLSTALFLLGVVLCDHKWTGYPHPLIISRYVFHQLHTLRFQLDWEILCSHQHFLKLLSGRLQSLSENVWSLCRQLVPVVLFGL